MTNSLQVLDSDIPARRETPGMIEVAQSRAAQEVQAAMVVAKRFPRDQNEAFARIMQACKRKALAEQSQYSYPRGGSRIEGPSIRLAEVVLQNWGNCESGIIELERREGESLVMTYAVDLETNARDVKVFTVPHIRERGEGKGGNVMLTDPRDIYELVANQGARRKRACMLAIVPGDIVEAAVDECNRTLKGKNQEPLADRTRQIVASFLDVGVTSDMLVKRLGHVLDVTSEAELVSLRKIYTSLKDSMGKAADWFDVTAEKSDLAEGKQPFGFKKQAEEKKAAETPESPASARPEMATLLNSLGTETQTEEAPAGDPSKDPAEPEGFDAALAAEARAREEAEAKKEAPQSEADERRYLLVEIDSLQNKRKMFAASRAGLWKQFCKGNTRDQAEIEQLKKLLGHLRTVAGGQGNLI